MVEWKSIKETCNSLNKAIIKQGNLKENGKYPVINSGVSLYGWYDSYNNESNAFTLASRGEYAGFITYIAEPFWAGGLCYPYRSKNELLYSTKFIFQFLKNKEKNIMETLVMRGGIPALNKADVEKILIPIPSLEEQNRIVGILDTYTDSIENLKQQIAQRRKQYEHYRDQLLDLGGKEGVEMKVSDFCLLKAGKGISASEIKDVKEDGSYSCFGGNGIRGFVTFYSHEGKFPIIGRQGALCGCVAWASGKFYATEHAVVASGKENTNQRFLFYLFQQANLNQYKSQGAQPGLSVAKLNELLFRIPSLSEQQRIVSILDTFEASITNLEAQLTQRQKQYEYFRNQLLTFE
jgi:type I restriction enzyme S subunit